MFFVILNKLHFPGCKIAVTFTFILRLIDAEEGHTCSGHSKPVPDPKAHTQEDICGNL